MVALQPVKKPTLWQRLFGGVSTTQRLHHLLAFHHQAEGEMWLLREKVYSLSSTVGNLEARIQLKELSDALHEWMQAEDEKKHLIAKVIESSYGFDGCLVVTDMSGFTRVTREEGILHFMMLIKEMQAICVPIFERFGGRLVKTEADDLFIIFPGSSCELAVRAVLRCMKATAEFSAGKPRNSQIIIAAGIIAGPMYLLSGLDVFGGVVPLGFRIGEDETPNGMLYVHQSVKERVEDLGTVGLSDPSRPLTFEHAKDIDGHECHGETHALYTVKQEQAAAGHAEHKEVLGYRVGKRDKRGRAPATRVATRGRRASAAIAPAPSVHATVGNVAGKVVHAAGHAATSVEHKLETVVEGVGMQLGVLEEQKELMLLRRARLKPKWCVTNAVINSEEPQELMLMMSERMQCTTQEGRAYCDDNLLRRFARKSATVLVIVIDIHRRPDDLELRDQELFALSLLLKFKEFSQQAVTSSGGTCMTAVQKRTFPAAFCILPSPTAAFDALVMVFKWVRDNEGARQGFPRGAVSLRAAIATGELLDFGGNNAFGDPVNTAFKLAEDVAAEWDVLLQKEPLDTIAADRTAPWGFEEKSMEISHVTLKYAGFNWASDEARAAAEKLELVRVVAQSNTHALDWSGLGAAPDRRSARTADTGLDSRESFGRLSSFGGSTPRADECREPDEHELGHGGHRARRRKWHASD